MANSDRFERLRRIETLDPEHEFQAIYRDMVQFEFPFEMTIGFHLAFIRPFAVPRISRITAGTGEITRNTRKRIDDTAILLFELYENGFDHPRGQLAVRRINQIHRYWRTSNDDYIYVLATLVIPPMRVIERYGWRRSCEQERRSSFLFYRELGRRMGVRDFPDSYDCLVDWFQSYEDEHVRYHPANAELMGTMHQFVGGRVPPPLRWLVNRGLDSLLEEPVRQAIGLGNPSGPVRLATHAALRARAAKARRESPVTKPLFVSGQAFPSYPDGYQLDQIGPPDQRELANRLRSDLSGGLRTAH